MNAIPAIEYAAHEAVARQAKELHPGGRKRHAKGVCQVGGAGVRDFREIGEDGASLVARHQFAAVRKQKITVLLTVAISVSAKRLDLEIGFKVIFEEMHLCEIG